MEPTEEIEKSITDDESTPLTKPKSKAGRPKNPPKIKEKKPRTEKQMLAFAKAQETIKANKEKKKEEKKIEASKLLLSKGIELPSKQPKPQPVLNLPPVESQDTDTEEEEEIVYVKREKKVKPKAKKRKKIIVYQDSSSSGSSSEEDEEIDLKPKHFKSQRNKKSLIKVYDIPQHKPVNPITQSINYFCD